LIPQHAVTRLVCGTDFLQLTPADRVAQASNLSFDAATFEIWGALLNGATLVGIPKDTLLSPTALPAALAGNSITVLFVTTALLNQIVSETPNPFTSLKHLLFGGEAADPKWVRKLLNGHPPERVLHVYGPTESTTFATWHELREVPDEVSNLPIGRPIANTTVYILDPWLQPVPVGVAGELYTGGEGLARGYLHQPELTASRFIPDPFGSRPGARLYRTGDLARWGSDGQIEFLGRIDHQLKIRGFRIEPGEVEAVLSAHPAVKEALVMARQEPGWGDKRLVAYLVLREQGPGRMEELRLYLKERLPEYMVPSYWVALAALPLNPNGKVDRKLLPPPVTGDSGSNEPAAEESRNPVEAKLLEIWREVLGSRHVSVRDNFFDLGGHSLLATQVISRIARVFGVSLPLRALFDAPVLASLAESVREAQSQAGRLTPRAGGHPPVIRKRILRNHTGDRLERLDKLPEGGVEALPNSPIEDHEGQ
jgi:acyl-coenzyme A synthetase/AMP-(fatty) acid ligase